MIFNETELKVAAEDFILDTCNKVSSVISNPDYSDLTSTTITLNYLLHSLNDASLFLTDIQKDQIFENISDIIDFSGSTFQLTLTIT